MKAEIKARGTLLIQSENELEAYALRKWVEENKGKEGQILFDLSFPGISNLNNSVIVNSLGQKIPDVLP